jgi:hypothetical protein
MSKPLFEKEEMVHLTALGCDVHAAAWDNFVQNHKVELYRPVKHVSKAEARAGGVVGGYETNNLLALRMANIAPHVVDDTLANVFSTVAERLAAGQHDVVLRHVATVAIAATYLDAAYPSDLKEEEVEENCVPGPHDCADHKEVVKEENCTIKAFKAGNPIVTESIREFEAWFSSMSEEKLFETMELDENASERNRAAGGYTYEEWTVCDRCGGEGKDLDNGPSGSGPECAECGGEGGWPADDESLKEAADDVIAEGDLDEDLLVSKEDSEELEQEDVLLPKNGGNDLAREVTVADDEAQGEDAVQRLKTLAGVTGAQSQRPLNLR